MDKTQIMITMLMISLEIVYSKNNLINYFKKKYLNHIKMKKINKSLQFINLLILFKSNMDFETTCLFCSMNESRYFF